MQRQKAILLTVIAILLAITLSVLLVVRWYFAQKEQSEGTLCNNYLRQIDSAKQQAAFVLKPTDRGQVPTEEQITPYLYKNKVPQCPSGGQYWIDAWNNTPKCSLRDTNAPLEKSYYHSLKE